MKTKTANSTPGHPHFFPLRRSAILWLTCVAFGLIGFVNSGFAQTSGTWTNNGSGSWADSTNWGSGVIASGTGTTADFTTLDVSGTNTITNNQSGLTLGTLKFGDTNSATPGGWVINSGTITMAVTSGTAIISASNSTSNVINSAISVGLISGSTPSPVTITSGTGSTITFTGGMQAVSAATQGGSGMTINGGGTVVFAAGTYSPAKFGVGTSLSISGAGTVLNVTGSALLDSKVLLNTNSGTVIDFNSTAGAMTLVNINNNGGGGKVKLTLNSLTLTGVTGIGGGSSGIGGVSGGGGVTFLSGTYQMNNLGSSWSGGTTLSGSTYVRENSGGSNSFSDTAVMTINGGSVLDLNNVSETIGSLIGSGTIGNSGTTSGAGLVVNTALGGSSAFSGVIRDVLTLGGTAGTRTVSVTKKGINTLTLSGLNTYTAGTTINNGTLLLDLSTNTTGVLASTGTLTLGGGTLNVQGKNTGASSQTLSTLVLTASTGSGIVVNNNGGAGTTLTLGNTWTRGARSTLNIDLSSGGTLTSSPALLNGLVVGGTGANTVAFATVTDGTSTGFATVSGGNVVRYTGATVGLPSSGASSTTNYSTSGAVALLAGGESVNSLAIDASSAGSLDLGAGTLTITTGGFLMTGANNYTVSNGQLGASGSELIIHQYGTGTLTVSSTISGGAGSLTKAGSGILVLAGSNSYTGPTTLNGGVVNFSNLNNLGAATAAINFGGGTLQYATGNTADITSGRTVALAGAGGTIDTNGNNVTLTGSMSGSGGLTKAGNGTLTLSGNANYSGDTTVNGGSLLLDLTSRPTGVLNAGTVLMLNNGTNFTVKGATSGTSTQTLGGLGVLSGGNSIVLNSNGGSGVSLTINNSWVRNAGATVNFDLSSSASNSLLARDVSNTNGIIGGWATITDSTGTGFASYNDVASQVTNTVVRYTGATALGASSNSGTTNYTTSGTLTMTAGNKSLNSLAIDTSAGAGSLTPGSPTDVLSLASGGLLMTGGNDYNITFGQTGSSNNELIVQQYGTGNLTISGSVSGGTGSLTKAGPGMLTLAGTSTYSGATNVNGGTLNVTGSIASATTVANGSTLKGSGTVGAVTVSAGGTLAGTLQTGALTVQSGGILSPGNSPGVLTASSATFLSGGKYILQLNNDGSSGVAGTNWDQVAITGTLDLSGLSSGNQFVLTLQTLNGSNNPSPLALFDASVNHTWVSIITTGGLTLPGGGFNSNLFSVDTSGFQNSFTGTFSVIQDAGNSNNLDLVYTAVPEPSTFAMALGGFGILISLQRLRRRRA